jgi:aerobic carbon-monoxide dehydrogenase large subunit
LERIVYGSNGRLLTGSFMDYALPRATGIAAVALESIKALSHWIGVPATLVNAVIDALSPFGMRHLDMPLTSYKVLHAMKTALKEKDR